ncbi:MAG: 4-alpha-glucanotransferase [Clostridium sp.]
MKRSSGVIMHISSLPGKFGIGTFGKEAYKFGEFLKESGISYWQILPLGQTSYGDSPYQCFSAFGGNPYFIDFEILEEWGILSKVEYECEDYGDKEEVVDYGKLFISKYKVLKRAFNNFSEEGILKDEYEKFKVENSEWLDEYSFYMAVKESFSLESFLKWDNGIKRREEKEVVAYKNKLSKEIEYWSFLQFLFYKQWNELKGYVNSLGIKIIGDVPIYVAEDSSDVYSNIELFKFDKEEYVPLMVAGCPPDAFSQTGQLWGNPIYNWEYHEKTGFSWWIKRIKASLKLYDIIRIDHFRGFQGYWEIPYGEKTAINGKWVKGPGIKLFNKIKEKLGDIPIIAEDLGIITDDVVELREKLGYPGMRVLQFAFSGECENYYLPHNYVNNAVVYTGTHDNDTIIGWYEKTSGVNERNFAMEYLASSEKINWAFIREAFGSVGDLAITTMQDYLNLGNDCRMNFPSTIGGNWCWRMSKDDLTKELSSKIMRLNMMYRRAI